MVNAYIDAMFIELLRGVARPREREQLLTCKYLLGPPRESDEQRELASCEVEGPLVDGRCLLEQIDCKLSD